MQIQRDALEQVRKIKNAIATSLEDFDLVVEAFDKAAVLALNEVVGDFLPPGGEQLQEIVKAVQATFLNSLYPT